MTTRPPHDPNVLTGEVQAAWHRFLDVYEPLRPELYRYCRYLTRSPWGMHDYFFTPDVIAEICTEIGVPYHTNGYRYW
jgi:RNA polymerase sigma-70 factor (ECF subfamily)